MSPARTVTASSVATGGWCFTSGGTGTTVTVVVELAMPSDTVYSNWSCSVIASDAVMRATVLFSTSTESRSPDASVSTVCTASTRPLGDTSLVSTASVVGSPGRRYAVSFTAIGG